MPRRPVIEHAVLPSDRRYQRGMFLATAIVCVLATAFLIVTAWLLSQP